MQVLAERITALITVIQSFAFFPAASKYRSGIIPFFLVNSQMPITHILPTCFVHAAKAHVTLMGGKKVLKCIL